MVLEDLSTQCPVFSYDLSPSLVGKYTRHAGVGMDYHHRQKGLDLL